MLLLFFFDPNKPCMMMMGDVWASGTVGFDGSWRSYTNDTVGSNRDGEDENSLLLLGSRAKRIRIWREKCPGRGIILAIILNASGGFPLFLLQKCPLFLNSPGAGYHQLSLGQKAVSEIDVRKPVAQALMHVETLQ